MAIDRTALSELCFAAEGMAGTAGSSALRKVRSLAEAAPAGRMFGAITTLSELSRKSASSLAAADQAMAAGDTSRAVRQFARAISAMDDMAASAEGAVDIPDLLRDLQVVRS